jgi:phosphatidylglycerophosphate synthase
MRTRAANFISVSRLVLAAVWLSAFLTEDRRPEILGPIALAAAASDFLDGWLARRLGVVGRFGEWLDSLADIAFVLTALVCEVHANTIPAYIPALISVSFAQYAIDSVLIHGTAAPVRSRLGHIGGILNYALVIVLAFTPTHRALGALLNGIAPLLAIFYVAAIAERAAGYLRWPQQA